MNGNDETVVMFRPTGPRELALVASGGFRRWPPRLPGQPIFYPVQNQEYAAEIAEKWNVPEAGAGYVTRFQVRRSFADRYALHQVGAAHHLEWWIPAADLEQLNENIVGKIEIVAEYGGEARRE